MTVVKTPPNIKERKKKLQDTDYVSYIIRLEHGFYISIAECTKLNPAKKNMMSADINPQVIYNYLTKELQAGNILRPFQPSSALEAHINRFGMIPKKYQPDKWKLI